MLGLPKRLLVGRPLRSEYLDETLLPKKLALPVFCSDPLSSNAYATEEILLMLSLGGLALLHLTPWVAAVVIVLLVVVLIFESKAYVRSGLTTQAQRPGPRDATIATVMRWPGSLQRMVSEPTAAAAEQ